MTTPKGNWASATPTALSNRPLLRWKTVLKDPFDAWLPSEGVILIDSEGGVFSSGENSLGQLGRSSGCALEFQRISNIPLMLAVTCGCSHPLSLDESGGVWSWGSGLFGQLGTGNTSNQQRPTLVPSLQRISALVAGGLHSLAFSQEGGLLVFGRNARGQLGLNHTFNLSTPALCPVLPALPHSFTHSRKKSARFL